MKMDAAILEWFDNSNLFYVTCINMDGTYRYVNPYYSKTFGYEYNYLVGKPFYITMHTDDIKVCEECSAICFANPGKNIQGVLRKHDGKGGYVVTKWDFKALFTDKMQPSGMLCVGTDITESIKEKKDLQDTKVELHKSLSVVNKKDKLINQLTYELSHTIRKPLANILGLTMIIDKADLDLNTKYILNLIKESAQELDEVVVSHSQNQDS